jgi:peptidoglycan hydrolase-like protein with peptidoglycan-binding domain
VDTQSEDGELAYGDTTSVTGRLAGTVTAVAASGSTVSRGEALYRVDDRPVVLLYGTMPAYRALSAGTEGADVKQFEQNLYDLGYRGFTVDEKYSESTATAVKKWQDKLDLAETGTVELGRVVYAPAAVRVASVTAKQGAQAAPGAEVLQVTGTARQVSVDLDMADQRLARTGSAVQVQLPDGKDVPGKVTKVETVIQPAQGNQPESTKLAVTVTLDDERSLGDLGDATVEVSFTASKRENVLTVPVAALLALLEGGYGVQVVDGTATRIVPVQTGLFAGGRVEVTGEGLTEGTVVGMPS